MAEWHQHFWSYNGDYTNQVRSYDQNYKFRQLWHGCLNMLSSRIASEVVLSTQDILWKAIELESQILEIMQGAMHNPVQDFNQVYQGIYYEVKDFAKVLGSNNPRRPEIKTCTARSKERKEKFNYDEN